MKHTISLFCSLLLFTAIFASCTEDEELLDSQLVVEGWIEEGGYPLVTLGQTLSPESGTAEGLADYAVRWGKVTISDGTDTVVLTGGYDKKQFIGYKYTTYRMKGQAGKTYTLTAEHDGRRVQAVTTLPRPVPLDSIRVMRCEGDTLYYIRAFFTDNPAERNRYVVFSQREGTDKGFLLSFWGVLNDEAMQGSTAINIYRGSDFFSEMNDDASMYFKKGDIVRVKFAHVDEVSYRFWSSYAHLTNFSSNMFFPFNRNLESNIIGGKGYWCGYGSYTCNVIIR